MAAASLSGAALLESVKADILRLYATVPPFGTVSFGLVFHDGVVVRIIQSVEIQKQAKR